MFRALLKIVSCLGLAFWCVAAPANPARDFRQSIFEGTRYSVSRQFVIHDKTIGGDYLIRTDIPTNFVRLDPALLAVSCERIKAALLAELGARDEWTGKIYLDLHHSHDPEETIVVAPVISDHKWSYHLQVPDLMSRPRLISAMIEILLLEMANRNSMRSAEIPAWLAQGLSRQIILTSQTELVLEPPKHLDNGIALNRLTHAAQFTNPLAETHENLRTAPPLTLQQLSWPGEGQFQGEAGEMYRSSAQFFVHGLLQFRDGRDCLRTMVLKLPEHLNWQMTFLQAFHSHFTTQLDVEKWWALQLVQFTGRDLSQTWPYDESWMKLDQIVRPVVQVRTEAGELPLRSQVPLRTIIEDWELTKQTAVLQEKARQMVFLRSRVAQDLVYLVDDYRQLLDNYLKRRANNVTYTTMGKMLYSPRVDDIARDTLRELDRLEARREQMRPRASAPSASPFTASVTN